MLSEVAGLGQHFQTRGHNFSLYGPTLSRLMTFFSCGKMAYKLVGLPNFVIELAHVPSTQHRKKI